MLQLEKLSDKQCQPESQLKFITEAWQQVKYSINIIAAFGDSIFIHIIDLLLPLRREYSHSKHAILVDYKHKAYEYLDSLFQPQYMKCVLIIILSAQAYECLDSHFFSSKFQKGLSSWWQFEIYFS